MAEKEEWPPSRRERIRADRARMLERALVEAGYLSKQELPEVLTKERVIELLASILADGLHFAESRGIALSASEVRSIEQHALAFCAEETAPRRKEP